MKKGNYLVTMLLCCCLFLTGAHKAFCHPIDTLETIYNILADTTDAITILDKSFLLYEKQISFKDGGRHLIDEFREYVKSNPNTQVEILSELFINSGYASKEPHNVNFDEINKIVRQAILLEDKCVAANAFWLVGRIYSHLKDYEKAITYYYASALDFKEIRKMKFTSADYIDFDICKLFYLTSNYRACKEYGLKCYRDIDNPQSVYKGHPKIILLDLLGASYKKIGMIDSSLFYYKEIQSELTENSDFYTKKVKDIWYGIVDGNIGEQHFNLGNYTKAEPYINSYYNESICAQDTLNILLSSNLYARLCVTKGEDGKAIHLWKNILKSPVATRNYTLLETVNDNLAQTFRQARNIDSAFYYYESRDRWRSTIEQERFVSELNRIKQNFEFSMLSENVHSYEATIGQVKSSYFLTSIIILLSFSLFFLILYMKRKGLKRELDAQRLRAIASEKSLNLSQERSRMVKSSLIERNNLAQYLLKRISNLKRAKETGLLINEVENYILTTEDGWKHFKETFLEIHPEFINNLEKKFPDLSPAEQRLIILLYLNLEVPDIARLLGISSASVSKAKYRLKLALKLESSDDLRNYIRNI